MFFENIRCLTYVKEKNIYKSISIDAEILFYSFPTNDFKTLNSQSYFNNTQLLENQEQIGTSLILDTDLIANIISKEEIAEAFL